MPENDEVAQETSRTTNEVVDRHDTRRTPTPRVRRPQWERKLPSCLSVAALKPGRTSLYLKVEVESPDMLEKRIVRALVDCGATGMFIDREYVRSNRITTRKLSQPIPVYNVDGTANEAGSINKVADLLLRYCNLQ